MTNTATGTGCKCGSRNIRDVTNRGGVVAFRHCQTCGHKWPADSTAWAEQQQQRARRRR